MGIDSVRLAKDLQAVPSSLVSSNVLQVSFEPSYWRLLRTQRSYTYIRFDCNSDTCLELATNHASVPFLAIGDVGSDRCSIGQVL